MWSDTMCSSCGVAVRQRVSVRGCSDQLKMPRAVAGMRRSSSAVFEGGASWSHSLIGGAVSSKGCG